MFVKYVMIILLLYALVPLSISKTYLNIRLGGLPLSYVPFIIIYLTIFFKNDLKVIQSKRLLVGFKWLLIWLFITLLSFLANAFTNESFKISSFFIDFFMIFFYILIGYLGQILYLTKKYNSQKLEEIMLIMVKYLSLIVIFGSIRYFIFDRGEAPFFNLLNPLNYRLFEVLLLVFITPISIANYLKKKSTISLIYVIILTSGIFMSGSRTAYVALSLLIPIMLLYKDVSLAGLLKMVIPVLLVGVVIFYDEDIQRNLARLDMIKHYIDLNFQSAVEDDQVIRRVGMIAGSKEIILNNLFFGVGLGKENYFAAFPEYYLDYFHIGRPHNQYLSLASSTGLLGLIAFLLFFYSIIAQGFHTLKKITKKHPSFHLVRYLIASNVLIFVTMIGYEYETEPFIWLIWSISTSFFYLVNKQTQYK